MLKSLCPAVFLITLISGYCFAFEPTCYEKIISNTTKTGILKDYYIDELMCLPRALFIINGKEIEFIIEEDDIENWLKNKKGKKFQITITKVYGPIGDTKTDYDVISNAKLLK